MCVWVCVLWVAPILVMVGWVAFRIYWKILSYYNNHEFKVHWTFWGGIIGYGLMTITLATWQPCGCYATWQSCGCYTITGILGVLSHGSHVDIWHHMRAMLIYDITWEPCWYTTSHESHADNYVQEYILLLCYMAAMLIHMSHDNWSPYSGVYTVTHHHTT